MSTRHPAHPLGVRPRYAGGSADGGSADGEVSGVDVAVLASHAEAVDFCVLHPAPGGGWREERFRLPHCTHGVWHGYVPGVRPGQHYGFRAFGPWQPERGQFHNPAKLLLDPYARAIAGRLAHRPELYGHRVDDQFHGAVREPDPADSAAFAPHGVVAAGDLWLPPPAGQGPAANRPRVPMSETVIYEAHVRGLTRRLPAVPEGLRGTYAGLAHPAAIEHLLALGVTSVELLPVQAIGDEPALARRGVPNYWGYSTLGFFAPHAAYAADPDPLGAVAEFARLTSALHEAGLEVLLDVVYNHTCEAGVEGPLLSWRGLDAATYYRLDAHGRDVDVTGCGNSLDFSSPRVVQLTLDSLRYWVQHLGVDGFRFDLATTLARGRDGSFDPDHPLLVALQVDPVLAGVKLIAEPWDLGPHGWRTGQFPAPLSEWNDRFRDGVREFWLTGARRASAGEAGGGVRDLATRLAGSADLLAAPRGPAASINFVAAHDGFTVADLTAYDHKHNEANGEGNRDGADLNHSWNHGAEGPTDDPQVLAARRRSMRNLLGTLLLSTGVPMLLAGDELGRSQGGNNNAYCQDNPTSWLDWELAEWQRDLLASVRALLALRREYPVLRQDRFFAGRPVRPDGTKDLAWFGPDGTEMDHDRWHDPHLRTLQMYLLAPEPDGSLLIVIQGSVQPMDVTLPGAPWAAQYQLLWDSAGDRPLAGPGELVAAPARVAVPELALQVYAVR